MNPLNSNYPVVTSRIINYALLNEHKDLQKEIYNADKKGFGSDVEKGDGVFHIKESTSERYVNIEEHAQKFFQLNDKVRDALNINQIFINPEGRDIEGVAKRSVFPDIFYKLNVDKRGRLIVEMNFENDTLNLIGKRRYIIDKNYPEIYYEYTFNTKKQYSINDPIPYSDVEIRKIANSKNHILNVLKDIRFENSSDQTLVNSWIKAMEDLQK